MKFPEAPTCHAKARRWGPDPISWREPRVDKEYGVTEPFRRCSYCGSIHPEDLIRLLGEGATLNGADWKYGWPHKFYVEGVPNKTTEVVAKVGSNSKAVDGVVVTTPILGKPPRECHVKWYNEHIMDEGYDDEARCALMSVLEASGITFSMKDGELVYRSPCHGFQK